MCFFSILEKHELVMIDQKVFKLVFYAYKG